MSYLTRNFAPPEVMGHLLCRPLISLPSKPIYNFPFLGSSWQIGPFPWLLRGCLSKPPMFSTHSLGLFVMPAWTSGGGRPESNPNHGLRPRAGVGLLLRLKKQLSVCQHYTHTTVFRCFNLTREPLPRKTNSIS